MRLGSVFERIGPRNSETGGSIFRKGIHTKTLHHSFGTLVLVLCWSLGSVANAQVNEVGDKPYLGWSGFPEQTVRSNFLTQANMTAQSDALLASGLQAHGFRYINLDSGWQGSFDGYGRPIPNSATFPDISALVARIHQNGQKAGDLLDSRCGISRCCCQLANPWNTLPYPGHTRSSESSRQCFWHTGNNFSLSL